MAEGEASGHLLPECVSRQAMKRPVLVLVAALSSLLGWTAHGLFASDVPAAAPAPAPTPPLLTRSGRQAGASPKSTAQGDQVSDDRPVSEPTRGRAVSEQIADGPVAECTKQLSIARA